jgi:hypothetical protein
MIGSSDGNIIGLLTTTGTGCSADLQDLVDATRHFASNTKANNTKKAYQSDWNLFTTWCMEHGFSELPAPPEVVALYLSHLATTGKKAASISRTLVSISQFHKMGGHQSPTSSAQVLEIMKGIRRTLGSAQNQKEPVMPENLKAIMQVLPDTLLGRHNWLARRTPPSTKQG